MVTLDPINVNEPRPKRTYTYNEEDIKAIAKEGLEQTQEFEAASGSKFKLFENIVDKDGHKRFIEGDIEIAPTFQELVTKNYGKWALSGSHLLIVLAYEVDNGTELPYGAISLLKLPKWIMDKLVPLFSNAVSHTSIRYWADNLSAQDTGAYLRKLDSETLDIYLSGAVTLTADRSTRIAFDLLIDNN